MHKNTLSDAVEKLRAEELESLLNETAKRLAQRGFFAKSRGHFALDATDLETTPKCLGAGVKKYRAWKVIRDKQTDKRVVEVERLVYGFKVLIVYEVRLRLVVAARSDEPVGPRATVWCNPSNESVGRTAHLRPTCGEHLGLPEGTGLVYHPTVPGPKTARRGG